MGALCTENRQIENTPLTHFNHLTLEIWFFIQELWGQAESHRTPQNSFHDPHDKEVTLDALSIFCLRFSSLSR
jgi:hypothetical protein